MVCFCWLLISVTVYDIDAFWFILNCTQNRVKLFNVIVNDFHMRSYQINASALLGIRIMIALAKHHQTWHDNVHLFKKKKKKRNHFIWTSMSGLESILNCFVVYTVYVQSAMMCMSLVYQWKYWVLKGMWCFVARTFALLICWSC